MNEEFKEGDLMPWQDMTAKIKLIERLLEGTPEDVMIWEAILDIRRTLNWDRDTLTSIKNNQVFINEHTERLQALEKEIGRMSFLGYDANEQFKLITNCLEKIKELETRVDSLTRTLDFIQNDIGIEVAVTPGSDVSAFQQKSTHEGQCEACDRVAPLNSGNICEGCFYEELYDEANLAL